MHQHVQWKKRDSPLMVFDSVKNLSLGMKLNAIVSSAVKKRATDRLRNNMA